MSDAPELKPCPFCGGEAELWPARGGSAWVACVAKCSVLVTRQCETDTEAVSLWNTRADLFQEAIAAAMEEAADAVAIVALTKDKPDVEDAMKAIRALIPTEGTEALERIKERAARNIKKIVDDCVYYDSAGTGFDYDEFERRFHAAVKEETEVEYVPFDWDAAIQEDDK